MSFKPLQNSFVLVAACLTLMIFAAMPMRAGTSCHGIPDPRYPGLKRCIASVDIDTVEAAPPEPQKMSLWCWAASLSMIYTAAGHPISQESIVIQNFGKIENTTGGDFLTFQDRLSRVYTDDNGDKFRSVAAR